MGKYLSLVLLASALVVGCNSEDAGQEAAAKPAMPPAVVSIQQPEPGMWRDDMVIVGSLAASESALVSAEIAGLLKSMHVKDGQAVKAGQKLFTLDSATLAAELKRTQAMVQLRTEEIKRVRSLFERNVGSQYDVDKAVAELATAKADEEFARARLDKATIHAPFDGNVGIRQVNPGNYLKEGDNLIELVQLDPIMLDFHLPETALTLISQGQSIDVDIPALRQSVEAEVVAVEPAIDEKTRSVLVRAYIANEDKQLRPGLFARIQLPTAVETQALWLPEGAIFYNGDKKWVMLNDEGRARRVPVELAGFKDGRAAVISGIEEDDQIVVAGHHKAPFDGMPLMPAPPAQPGEDQANVAKPQK